MITVSNCPLDQRIEWNKGRIPKRVHESLLWVNDTLGFCLASAQQVFGKDATPDLALQIYDRLVSRIKDDPELSKDLQDDVPS